MNNLKIHLPEYFGSMTKLCVTLFHLSFPIFHDNSKFLASVFSIFLHESINLIINRHHSYIVTPLHRNQLPTPLYTKSTLNLTEDFYPEFVHCCCFNENIALNMNRYLKCQNVKPSNVSLKHVN